MSTVPDNMRAAVYRGSSVVSVDEVHTPEIGAGEILIRVEACGVCHTDLKKIEYNLLAPPRIFGHETAGIVAAIGSAVTRYKPGDRVIVFHHIPCGECFYCERKLFAQCPVYKKVGVTAGWCAVRSGGVRGTGQYVREGRGSMRSAAARYSTGAGAGADRPDFHDAAQIAGLYHRDHRHDFDTP